VHAWSGESGGAHNSLFIDVSLSWYSISNNLITKKYLKFLWPNGVNPFVRSPHHSIILPPILYFSTIFFYLFKNHEILTRENLLSRESALHNFLSISLSARFVCPVWMRVNFFNGNTKCTTILPYLCIDLITFLIIRLVFWNLIFSKD